jgi:hypothetical protein
MNANTIKKMSDTVIACEIRTAWNEMEGDLRHGLPVRPSLSKYIAALKDEQYRRAKLCR